MAPTGEWRLIREEVRSGAIQMALDEVAARTAAAGGPRTVRVYSWDPSTLSMGFTQANETVDWEYCARAGIEVTRRQTGGGGIYHDRHGDISYGIIAPKDEFPGELLAAYHELLEPIRDAFERLGMPVAFIDDEQSAVYEPACYLRGLHPAHDLVVDGRKISGNAQYRQREAVIQHGSLMYERTTERHLGVFADPPDVGTFDARVTSIHEQTGATRDHVIDTLESTLAEWCDADVGGWTEAELATARELAAEKYSAESWVCNRNAP